MRLFRPLSWISQSRGNSPVASPEEDGRLMMAPSADVENHFNDRSVAENAKKSQEVNPLKRKLSENVSKQNRAITDFFSSGPAAMGSSSSKESAPRDAKKRRLDDGVSQTFERVQRPRRNSSDSGTLEALSSVEDTKQTQAKVELVCYESTDEEEEEDEEPMIKSDRELKAQRILQRNLHLFPSPLESNSLAAPGDAADADQANHLRDIFAYQLNLEIKLQHESLNELRAEVAKSQIALEQLRRCHLIPFPQTYADPEAMLSIMEGTGSAVPQANGTKPKWATPFGVTEGAYTRHYAKWLIPDPRFDGVPYEHHAQGSGYPFPNMEMRMDGRQTRNSFQLDPVPKTKRRSRGDITAPLQALSSGYAQKKEDAGPSVLKRGDGQWVKLVCIDCQRENFGSTQGFINHCRIAHRREFKSHEEAAVNSGHVVEVDQFGGLVGEEKIPASVAYEGLVHHKIRSAPVDWSAAKDVLKRVNDALREFREGSLPSITHIPGDISAASQAPAVSQKPSKDFAPAASTPHLSKFLAKAGFNKNLNAAVEAAKAPLPEPEVHASDDEDADSSDLGELLIVESAPSSKIRRGSSNPTARPFFRAPILPAMRPSSSSSSATRQTPILPPPRPVSRKSHVPHISPQIALAKAKGQAQAKKVQAKINASVGGRMPPTPEVSREPSSDDADAEDDEDTITVAPYVPGQSDASTHDELSPIAHSEGDRAPSLVSDDDEYTAGSEDGEEDGEEDSGSESEVVEVRDESDEARSRSQKRVNSEEEIHVRSRVVSGRVEKSGQKKVSFVSPVKDMKKAARGKARR